MVSAALSGPPSGADQPVAQSKPAPPPATTAAVTQPPITSWRIPFPANRKREMARYSVRHYGINSYKLTAPKVIVEHVSVTTSARAVYNTFAPDRRDPELHELPGTCSHYVIGSDGTIYQLVSTSIMCRHALGMNYTSIGIEHVGLSDSDVAGHRREWRASQQLTNWLRCKYGIAIHNVIGHAETLGSKYFHENVKRLADSTHDDMKRATMSRYRADLRKQTCS